MNDGCCVLYAADRFGYSVRVYKDGELTYEYDAGNYVLESTTVIDPYYKSITVRVPQLLKWAKELAQELAEEYGADVSYDKELREDIRYAIEIGGI